MDEVSGPAPNPRYAPNRYAPNPLYAANPRYAAAERSSPGERNALEPGYNANGRYAPEPPFPEEARWGAGRPGEREERREERRPGRGGEPLDQRLERWVSRGREFVDGVSGARPGARPVAAAAERRAGGPGSGLPPQGNGGLGAGGLSPTRLGRWVEERLDWLLDDDSDDDWREPWQAAPTPRGGRRSEGFAEGRSQGRFVGREDDSIEAIAPPPRTARREPPSTVSGRRRSLEAISRRSLRPESGPVAQRPAPDSPVTPSASVPAPSAAGEADAWGDAWPDDASFSLNRWQRPVRSSAPDPLQVPPSPGGSAGANGRAPGGRPLPRSTRRR